MLLLALSLSLLVSCGELEYDEAEVSAAAKELIPKTEEINNIYWGPGIGYTSDLSTSNGYYFEALITDLDKYGIKTIDDLKKKTEAVFSASYCENIFATKLNSVSDEDGVYSYARYYQKYSDANQTVPDTIMVYTKAIVLLSDGVEYLTDTLKVEYSDRERVYVTLDVKVTRGDESQIRSLTVGLVPGDNGWRIDTPTYISYDKDYNK